MDQHLFKSGSHIRAAAAYQNHLCDGQNESAENAERDGKGQKHKKLQNSQKKNRRFKRDDVSGDARGTADPAAAPSHRHGQDEQDDQDDEDDEGGSDADPSDPEVSQENHENPEYEKCRGFKFEAFPLSRIAQCKDSFHLYATYANLTCTKHALKPMAKPSKTEPDENLLHRYFRDVTKDEYTIFHRHCTGLVPQSGPDAQHIKHLGPDHPKVKLGQHLVCSMCRQFATNKSLIKNVCRFACKFYAARLLRAKMFLVELPQDIETEIKKMPAYKLVKSLTDETDMLMKISIQQLQFYVHTSFMCLPPSRWSPQMRFLVAGSIIPCIQVNPHLLGKNQSQKADLLARHLCTGKLLDVEDVDIKLGCMVASGMLESHPLLHGILISVCEKIRRESRGVLNMKGLRLSDTERRLVTEAGISLSMASANKSLMKEFALQFVGKSLTKLEDMLARGIPDPFLSICSLGTLVQNGVLLDNIFPRAGEKSCGRRLTLAFDKTYLLKQVNIISNRLGKGLVGVAFRPDHMNTLDEMADVGNAFVDVPVPESGNDDLDGPEESEEHDLPTSKKLDGLDFARLDHAKEMLDCVVFDPASRVKGNPRISICSIPMASDCNAEAMLLVLGGIMAKAGGSVRSLVCDNHGSHRLIKQALLGQYAAKPSIPFFGALEYVQLPPLEILNFGYQVPFFQEEPILFLNGPCHIQKKLRCNNCNRLIRLIIFLIFLHVLNIIIF